MLFQDWRGFSCCFHFSRFSCRSLASRLNLAPVWPFVGITLLDRLLECLCSPCVHELNMDCFLSNSCYFLFRFALFFFRSELLNCYEPFSYFLSCTISFEIHLFSMNSHVTAEMSTSHPDCCFCPADALSSVIINLAVFTRGVCR